MFVDGVGHIAVGGGEREGVLQGRGRVAVAEASLRLKDLTATNQECHQAVAQPVQRSIVDPGLGTDPPEPLVEDTGSHPVVVGVVGCKF